MPSPTTGERMISPALLLVVLSLCLAVLAGLSLIVGVGSVSDATWGSTILQLRGMRVIAACLVGCGLAIAGVVMQGLFRNPLADPGVIGTSAGAVFGGMLTVLVSYFLGASLPIPPVVLLPLGCVFGGMLSLWLVLGVAKRAPDNLSVLLAGVVMGMLFASLGTALNAWAQRDFELARSLMAFSFGSIDAKGFEHLLLATPLVLGGLWAALRWGPSLDVLLSGEEEAASLGVDLKRSRRWLIIWASLPVAGAVAIGGSIPFVGLVVPHILRGLVGPLHRGLLPCAAVAGAIFTLACDIIVRSLPTQGEIPVGVISGLIGAPLFLYLMVPDPAGGTILMAALLEAQGISVQVGAKTLLNEVDLSAESGELLSLIGPNGAGKTTLLKSLLGLIPHRGEVLINGQSLAVMTPQERARQAAYVPQFTLLSARLSGRDVVAQGRFAHRGQGFSQRDHSAVVDRALADTDCSELSERPFAVCSGGERSRLLLARALATEAPLLLLDEPTASLDLAHALHLYALLRRLAQQGKGIVMVQHQLSDALRWSDRTLVLHRGVVAAGATKTVLTEELMQKVFGLRMRHEGLEFDLVGKYHAY